jgi:hypothetical protein
VKLEVLKSMLIGIQILQDMTPFRLVKSTPPHVSEDLTLYTSCNTKNTGREAQCFEGNFCLHYQGKTLFPLALMWRIQTADHPQKV